MSEPRTIELSALLIEEIALLFNADPTGGEVRAWLDVPSRELVVISEDYDLDEEDADDNVVALRPRELPAWQQEERERLRAVLADETGRYLEVPVSSGFGQPGMLSDFASTVDDDALRERIYGAMRGRGAFRRVKDALHDAGQIQRWYDFQRERDREAVREWLEEEGVELKVT